jgi:predicted transcriptional regulator
MPILLAENEEVAMETKVLTADLPAELATKVDELAAELDRPMDSIVTEALSAWVQREEKRHHLILEGLADVDAGRLIDDSEIEAWIKGLETDIHLAAPTPRK